MLLYVGLVQQLAPHLTAPLELCSWRLYLSSLLNGHMDKASSRHGEKYVKLVVKPELGIKSMIVSVLFETVQKPVFSQQNSRN
jgi:hypothetical protein